VLRSVLHHIEPDPGPRPHRTLLRAATARSMAALTLAHVAAAVVIASAPAHAEAIDLDRADSSEIRAYETDLVEERTSVAEETERLTAEQSRLRALIEQTHQEFGTIEAQLVRATEAIDAASDDLSSKFEPLADLRTEQALRYEASALAGERIEVIAPTLSRLADRSETLSADIQTARRALQEAKERERQEAAVYTGMAPSNTENAPAGTGSVVGFAYDQVGKPYGSGSTGPNSYDCSGLVVAAYAQSGVSLPRTSQAQWAQSEPVDRGDLAPGDLVFSHDLGHVAIYVGGDQIVHATKPGDTVKIAPLDVLPVDGFRRVRD
jgi:cell wall-associated NlpC family hydrolase